jgi:hypothetical protein
VPGEPTLRFDWLGNDRPTPVSEVRTFPCRALHSNHMAGHVWQEYGSETLRERAKDADLGDLSGGGRGYYRNLSLVSVWAHAPFMHDNAVGPELCGQPANKDNDFYRSPYVDESGKPVANPPACMPYDPSVNGRFQVYKASMEALLNPDARGRKVSLIDQPIRVDVGPRTFDGSKEKKVFGLTLEFPAGLPASYFGNFQHKAFVRDLVLAKRDPDTLKAQLAGRFGAARADAMAADLARLADGMLSHPEQLLELVKGRLETVNQLYLSCPADPEDEGHPFGGKLPAEDKKALIAFLATL